MLNRLIIMYYIDYMFNNINNLNFDDTYEYFSKNIDVPFPIDMQKEVERHYDYIINNNKDIDINTQISIVNNFYTEFKNYLKNNNKIDRLIANKLFLIDLQLESLYKYISNNNIKKTK